MCESSRQSAYDVECLFELTSAPSFDLALMSCRHPGEVNFNRSRPASNLRLRGYSPTGSPLRVLYGKPRNDSDSFETRRPVTLEEQANPSRRNGRCGNKCAKYGCWQGNGLKRTDKEVTCKIRSQSSRGSCVNAELVKSNEMFEDSRKRTGYIFAHVILPISALTN